MKECPNTSFSFQIFPKKGFQLIERYLIRLIVKIGVRSIGNDPQLLVASPQLRVRALTEIAGMRPCAVDKQYGGADFIRLRKDGHVDERERAGLIPASVGIQ